MSTKLNGSKHLLCISKNSIKHQSFVYTQLNDQTFIFFKKNPVLHRFCLHTDKCKNSYFQTIQVSVITQFSSIWPIDRTLSGVTTTGQNGAEGDGNEWVHCIPQSSSISGVSPSDCLVSYPGHSLGESHASIEIQSVYSTAPANLAGGGLVV